MTEFTTNDIIKISMLEAQIVNLKVRVDENNETIKDLQKQINAVKSQSSGIEKSLATAETWGRATLWTAIALGGFITQLGTIVTWFKKL